MHSSTAPGCPSKEIYKHYSTVAKVKELEKHGYKIGARGWRDIFL